MKKLHSDVSMNDRIMIVYSVEGRKLTYYLVEARTGKKTYLGSIRGKRSPSIRAYFGGKGKTIAELYEFHRFGNKKLVNEMNWLWRRLEDKECHRVHKTRHRHMNKYLKVQLSDWAEACDDFLCKYNFDSAA